MKKYVTWGHGGGGDYNGNISGVLELEYPFVYNSCRSGSYVYAKLIATNRSIPFPEIEYWSVDCFSSEIYDTKEELLIKNFINMMHLVPYNSPVKIN